MDCVKISYRKEFLYHGNTHLIYNFIFFIYSKINLEFILKMKLDIVNIIPSKLGLFAKKYPVGTRIGNFVVSKRRRQGGKQRGAIKTQHYWRKIPNISLIYFNK